MKALEWIKINKFDEKTPDTTQRNTIQYNTIQYNTIQYNTIPSAGLTQKRETI
jgi:hypothetical protein